MEERKPISHVTAGLIIAGLLVVYQIIINFMGLTQVRSLGILQFLIIIGGLIYFVNQYGKANNNAVTFGNLFAFGFKATAVFTVINIIFMIIFFLIFPEMKEEALESARKQMEDNPKLTDDQIDQALEMSRKFFWVGVIGSTMLFMIIIGAIGSLIGAAVTKKRPVNPFEQQSV